MKNFNKILMFALSFSVCTQALADVSPVNHDKESTSSKLTDLRVSIKKLSENAVRATAELKAFTITEVENSGYDVVAFDEAFDVTTPVYFDFDAADFVVNRFTGFDGFAHRKLDLHFNYNYSFNECNIYLTHSSLKHSVYGKSNKFIRRSRSNTDRFCIESNRNRISC